MFDIDAILKTKQEQVAQIEEIQRPIKALYQLIVEEGSVSRFDLNKHGLSIRFTSKGFDTENRLTFECDLITSEFYSVTLIKKAISVAMQKKAYEVCFQSEGGSGKIILLGNAEAALSQVLKYLSTTMAPAIGNHIEKQLLKEKSK